MDLIKGFEADCRARNLTYHTIETYRSCCKDFLQRYPDPTSVGLNELRDYLGNLRFRGLQGSTLKGYFAAISSFYDYMVFESAMSINPVISFRRRYLSRIKDQHECRQLISIQDMRLLVKAAEAIGIRETAMILMLAKTGMRRGELLSLRVEDIFFKYGIVRIAPKAKRTNRLAFMDEELKETLEEYLEWREPKARTSWLWISDRGGRIHKDLPNRIFAGLGALLGLHTKEGPISGKLTCHCMRHFFVTYLFRAGMKPTYIKWLRGDSIKESWEIYNHVDPEKVREEYVRLVPKLLMG